MKRTLLFIVAMALVLLVSADGWALSIGKTKYIYKKGQGTWVKVTPGNKKQGPFSHPAELSAADVEKVLGSLQYFRPGFFSVTGKKGTEYQLLTEEEIGILADNVVQAFAEADSGTWVDFSVNTFRGQSFIGSFRQTDGVMFIKDGRINVAIRNIAAKAAADDQLSTFDPTRGYRSLTRLAPMEGQESVADNWVAMDLKALPSARSSAGAEAPVLRMPEITTNPEEPAVETDTPAGGPTGDQPAAEPASNRSAQERLLELQQLYDKGLINEEEYQKKRQEILDEL